MIETEFRRPSDVQPLSQIDIGEVLVRPEFKEWAGEDWAAEGLVMKDGETPTMFYHGGASEVEEFDRQNPRNTGPHQVGFYFSPRLHYARGFSDKLFVEQLEEGRPLDASLYAVFLKMKKPLFTTHKEFKIESIDKQPEGHDAVIDRTTNEVAVFDPSQIFIVKELKR